MHSHHLRTRSLILLTALSLVIPLSDASARHERSRPYGPRPVFASGWRDGGHLVIHRSPSLGHNVFVNLFIDDVKIPGIGYGHQFETFLRPGRHVLTVFVTPVGPFRTSWSTTVDVRRGKTYSFTALDDSRELILRPSGR